jgi:hypothetical protein
MFTLDLLPRYALPPNPSGDGLRLWFSISGVIFRSQINKPLFPTTFAEFQKDREWLTQTTINSE